MSLLTRLEKLEGALCPDPGDRITVIVKSFAEGEIVRVRYGTSTERHHRHGDSTIERRYEEDEESFLSSAGEEAWVSSDPSLNVLALFIERGIQDE